MMVFMSRNTLIPPSPTYDEAAAEAAPLPDDADPIALFAEWFAEAKAREVNDANAMALATCDADGLPDVRMVLLKDFEADGFVFYTNLHSAKGGQLASDPKAALLFHWKSLRRQVRIRGPVERVSDADADAYFATRARGSQLGAWASLQSETLEARETFEQRLADAGRRFEGREVPRPPRWTGFRVRPRWIEFWYAAQYRWHERVLYERDVAAHWSKRMLYP